jgi:hypothetical protein
MSLNASNTSLCIFAMAAALIIIMGFGLAGGKPAGVRDFW